MATLLTLDRTCPVLIFKAGRDTIHHGALGIARTLGRLGVPVYAIVEDVCAPVATSRYVTKAFVWKKWPGNREKFLEAISRIGKLIGRPTILIPMDDLSAVSIAENASDLSQLFLFPQLPWELPRRLANKANLYSLCAEIGVACPKAIVPRSISDVREFVERTTFPVMVKANDQWSLVNDRYSTLVVATYEDLLELYKRVKSEDLSQMILQEYIPGDDWIYHGYCDYKKNLYVSFTGKKLLSYPPTAGSTALGISLHNDAIRSQSEKLLRAIAYSGITDMDWRRDKRDGQYKMVDCNPRVGMNFRLFENTASIDVIRALHLNLTGRSVECHEMIEGRRFVVESFYFLAALRGWRRNVSSGKMPAVSGSRELAWWSRDDPLPFCAMWIRLFFRTIKRALLRAAKLN